MTETPSTTETDLSGLPPWYVVQTKPANECRVQTNLINQDIKVFLPQYESYQYAGPQSVRKIKPLFPNYLFARLDLNLHYYKVKWTRGVSKILGIATNPVPVSEGVIHAIRARMGADNLVKLEEEFKEGDLVCVTSGPFKDLTGIFARKMSDRARVRVLLNVIGVDVPVQISQWQIKKVA